MRKMLLLLAVALLLQQCGGSGTATRRTPKNPNVITAEEIARSTANIPMRNAYDVIKYLRPTFLKVRGTTSGVAQAGSTEPVVYVNNVRCGGPRALRNIFVEQIVEIRYLRPGDATMRFGLGHAGGAILVKLK
ncbi:MAG: hypothetical protein Q9P14_18540 [candidate division KSB1 bacterium]|nr:hypothetical protein [candidate division KSB1 bacterium]